jgi:hypothetical protein
MRSKRDRIKSDLLDEIFKVMKQWNWTWEDAKYMVKYSYADPVIRALIDEL